MASKVIRDPLYNYIAIDQADDGWLVDLLDCPEVQRLRRIHQLGVSDSTYPGACHTRFSHTLGVLHLMQQVLRHLQQGPAQEEAKACRQCLLAAAVLHDVGHGPFSHLFEPCLGIDHEAWSVAVIKEEGRVNQVLTRQDANLPEAVSQIIEKDNYAGPLWQKSLLSSQLDVDRMDYLRRDSLFTGAGYGHFDWYRIINTMDIPEGADGQREIVWPEKAEYAIEEYIFARFYMYQNVYLHKTSRGFEKMFEALWRRAQQLRHDGDRVTLLPAIAGFLDSDKPTVQQYLALEEFTVLQQVQDWRTHPDKALSDLARRVLDRQRFVMVEPPEPKDNFAPDDKGWEQAVRDIVRKAGFKATEAYCLKDTLRAKYQQPYFPEKQSDEQGANNAIWIKVSGQKRPVEISERLTRLQSITMARSGDRYRYYIPAEAQKAVDRLKAKWPT